jgi:hypothetical protein
MEADISILQKTGHFYFALTESALDICLGPRREPSFNEKFDSVLQKRAVARRVQREGRA